MMNDQIVELAAPGLQIILYSPAAAAEFEDGGRYAAKFPDGRDLVDHMNRCRFAAIGTRWPQREYWLHFSTTMDHAVITRASDHVRLGIEVTEQQLCVRGGDDLYRWTRSCPGEQVLTVANGVYNLTACMLPFDGDGPVRIYVHLASVPARPDLGYAAVPELFCEAPVWP